MTNTNTTTTVTVVAVLPSGRIVDRATHIPRTACGGAILRGAIADMERAHPGAEVYVAS